MKKRSEHTGSETRQENDDSTVGYRRPPVHTRFKPGESGNPKGRPKRAKNYRTVLNSILKEKVTVREGGKVRIMPKYKAILHALVMNAIQGKARARAILLELAREQGQFDPTLAHRSMKSRLCSSNRMAPSHHSNRPRSYQARHSRQGRAIIPTSRSMIHS